ncbi:MAG: HAD-IIIA family hydrolase [Gemmatimonadaceae bacterium]|nr:HAD-IIIA family hydrolase [Gemmatimonadaceae bacterium]
MTQRIDPAVAARIRLVVFDVDGVMTDGGIYLGATGVAGSAPIELKRYDIQDGLGVLLLRQAGLLVAIITGRVSESVRLRAQELKVDELVQDKHARKLAALTRLLDARGLTPEEVAFVGDDFPDAGPMRMVGLPVAVGNAVPEIKAMAQVTLTRTGGHGAVREFAELLLSARGEWVTQWERYVADRSALDGAEPRTAGRA